MQGMQPCNLGCVASRICCVKSYVVLTLPDLALSSLCEGCQRLEVVQPTTQLSWRVRICADADTPRLPKAVQEGRAHWAAWAWRASDAWALAAEAAQLFEKLFPQVRPRREHSIASDYAHDDFTPSVTRQSRVDLGGPTRPL